tara:strand:+ start:350 stop:811 length:462 start_codon:yes stop_codon:yes gene_type:complete
LDRIEGIVQAHGFVRTKDQFVRDCAGSLLLQRLSFIGSDPRSKTLITHPVLSLAFRSDRRPTPETTFGLWLAEFGARFQFEGANQISSYADASANFRWFELFEEVFTHVVARLDPILSDRAKLRAFLSSDPHFSRRQDLIAKIDDLPACPQGS